MQFRVGRQVVGHVVIGRTLPKPLRHLPRPWRPRARDPPKAERRGDFICRPVAGQWVDANAAGWGPTIT